MSTNCQNNSNANSLQCVNEAQYSSDLSLANTVVVNSALFLIFMAFFLMFRKRNKHIYEPLTFQEKSDVNKRHNSSAIPECEPGIFGWIKSVWKYTDKDVEQHRGLQAVMYLKVTQYLFFTMCAYGIYGFAILFPVHITAGGGLTGTGMLTMGNIPQNSNAFVADIIGVFCNSAIASFLLFALYKLYDKLRQQRKLNIDSYTILVTDLPEAYGENDVRYAFNNMYPDKISSIRMCYDVSETTKVLKNRMKFGLAVEKTIAANIKKGVNQTKRKYFCCGQKQDSLEYYDNLYNNETQKFINENPQTNRCAFITFTDSNTAKMAVNHNYNTDCDSSLCKTNMASVPECAEWTSIGLSFASRAIRKTLVAVATFLLIFFWMIPVVFASSLCNLTTLTSILPFLAPLLTISPVITGFIQGFLPGLVIIIFFAILVNFIITPLARAEGHTNILYVLQSVYSKYFWFMLFNIFLGSIFASGVISVISRIIADPSITLTLLAEALPKQANYFISYILILSLSGFALDLWRPGALIVSWIFKKFLVSTKRNYRDTEGPYYFPYHIRYATHTLVFIIVSCYSIMNPLIIAFGGIYFGLSYITGKYNIVYVYLPENHGQENIFPLVFNRLCLSLVVSQCVILAVLGINKYAPSAILVLAIIFQIVFWCLTAYKFYNDSVNGRINAFEENSNRFDNCFDKDAYKSPAISQPQFYIERDQSEIIDHSYKNFNTNNLINEVDVLQPQETQQTHEIQQTQQYDEVCVINSGGDCEV